MKIFVKYSVSVLWKRVLQDQLEKLGIGFTFGELSELNLTEPFSAEKIEELRSLLIPYGVEILTDQESLVVQRIKDAIRDLVYSDNDVPAVTLSKYLTSKINYSYGHLTSIFSEATSISIAHFMVMQKVERAKELMIETDLTLTEIAYRLNYYSLAHLSNQFKQITGLSPKRFKEIIEIKRSQKSLQGTEVNMKTLE